MSLRGAFGRPVFFSGEWEHGRMGRFIRGFCCFLAAFSLTVVAGLASAADYDVRARAGSFYTRNVTPAENVRSNTTFAARAMVPASSVIYTTREVIYSRATAASLLKFAVSPAGLVTTLALKSFFDWFEANPQNGDISEAGVPSWPGSAGTLPSGSMRIQCYSEPASVMSSVGACASAVKSKWTGAGYLTGSISGDGLPYYNIAYKWPEWSSWDFTQIGHIECLSGGTWSTSACIGRWSGAAETWDKNSSDLPPASWAGRLTAADMTAGTILTPDQFFDKFESSPFADDEDVLGDIFKDGQDIPFNTSEVQNEIKKLRDELATKDGTDPATLPVPATGPSADLSNPDAPFTQPDGWDAPSPATTGGGAQATEIPIFCTWASVVCDWLGWTKEVYVPDTSPELPVVPIEEGTWSSGLDGGACPAPIVVSVMGSSLELSWQPACDLVSMLRPLLIALAAVTAALIILGQRGGTSGG